MKIKTSELTGAALDWAVAKCEGYFTSAGQNAEYWDSPTGAKHFLKMHQSEGHGVHWTHISTDWAEGGPIIEQERIGVKAVYHGYDVSHWAATQECVEGRYNGPTPLVAAMRCYVASKMGDTVDIPSEFFM